MSAVEFFPHLSGTRASPLPDIFPHQRLCRAGEESQCTRQWLKLPIQALSQRSRNFFPRWAKPMTGEFGWRPGQPNGFRWLALRKTDGGKNRMERSDEI